MRKRIIAGNWKMYTALQGGEALVNEILTHLGENAISDNKEVVIIPPYTHIAAISSLISGHENISTGAQNCYFENEGAYTGEISPQMIHSCGAKYVIIGHSERRQYFHEDNAMLAKKASAALANELIPIYCCGETLEEREAGNHFDKISRQIEEGLFHLSAGEINDVVIAYEPIWAIGTGKTASAAQADEMHAHIRNQVAARYGNNISDAMCILYGGSVKPGNAAELFQQPNIDGGLIGGASLIAVDFVDIINA